MGCGSGGTPVAYLIWFGGLLPDLPALAKGPTNPPIVAVCSTDSVLIVQRRNRACGGVRVLRDAEWGAGAMLACGVLRGAALKGA